MKTNLSAVILLLLAAAFASAQTKNSTEKIPIDDDQSYVVISTKRIQTMEKELDDVASRGFRVLYGAPTQQYDMAILLKRNDADVPEPYQYKVLATSRIKTMEKEINENAKLGYRLLPRTIIFKQGLLTAELVMLMERAPRSGRQYEYKLVTGRKESKIHKEIDGIETAGFVPVTMIIIGENVVVMEKESAIN